MSKPLPTLTAEELEEIGTKAEDGFGCLKTAKGPLPLKAMDIQGKIEGLVAEVDVRQTFVNNLEEPLEATYIFPLPDRAAVTSFRMEISGRVVEGLLKERGEARREYDEAIQRGHRAAIAEEERPSVFTLRVGNLMAGEEGKVHLKLIGPIPVSTHPYSCSSPAADSPGGCEATFRFPLVVAPRYIPGVPLSGEPVGDGTAFDTDAAPDASRITPPVLLPGYPHPVRLSLSVDLRPAGLPITAIRSSLHAVSLDESVDGTHRIRLSPGERLDRDFVLRFRLAGDAVRTSLLIQPDKSRKGEGTFLLTVVPPKIHSTESRPRDLAFVLDRSGSMSGWKMVAARRAVARMVETLRDQDRFNVYAFDSVVEVPPGLDEAQLVPGTHHHRFQVAEFLQRIQARGGTEMARPLELAVKSLANGDSGRDRILVLVTDGQVGNEDQILRHLEAFLHQIRVFALGIDSAVNAGFLNRLSTLGGGICELVESEERLEEVMDKVHRLIATPILTDLKLRSTGLEIKNGTVVPERFPDLFSGVPVLLQGQCTGDLRGSMVLEGRDTKGKPWSEPVSAEPSASEVIAPLWARGRIRALEDKYAVGRGDRKALETEIIAASLQFGVLSRFTAYVAVDRSETVNQGGNVLHVTQPVELPQGWMGLADRILGCKMASGETMNSVEPMSLPKILNLQSALSVPAAQLLALAKTFASEAADFLGRAVQARVLPASQLLLLVIERLEILVKSLKSLKAPSSEVNQLRRLVLKILRAKKKGWTEWTQLEELFEECEQALRAFSGRLPPQPRRKVSFWK